MRAFLISPFTDWPLRVLWSPSDFCRQRCLRQLQTLHFNSSARGIDIRLYHSMSPNNVSSSFRGWSGNQGLANLAQSSARLWFADVFDLLAVVALQRSRDL